MLANSACVTSKTKRNELALETWLRNATLPVTVQHQTREMRCAPSLYCYTLIDSAGKIYYAQNVRFLLPRAIPPDPNEPLPRWWERLIGSN